MDRGLKQLLYEQTGGVAMSDELFERFVEPMTELRLRNKEVLIPYDKIDNNLYVLKEGIMRACYIDGGNEKTYGFADTGTVMISYHSHFMHRPSVFQIESCGETTVLKMEKKQLVELIDTSYEFAKWLLAIRTAQLYFNEFKLTAITGTAKERYISLIQNRPEILDRVPLKIIASYLGVAPNYLSYLKKIVKEEK
jgi:CRP-like cAMP-binding protein